MNAMTSIQHAYCVELDDVVSAMQAQREYLAREASRKWTFWCEYPECRDAKVRVICANYWRSATDEETYVAPHFRHQDEHLPGCAYEEGPDARTPSPGVENSTGAGRGSKAGDLISIFDPGSDDPLDGVEGGIHLPAGGVSDGGRGGHGGRGVDSRIAKSKTSFIEDLVDQRADLRKKLSASEFDAYKVSVKQGPKIRLVELFKHVLLGWDGSPERVWHGGCKLLKPRFGLGFKLEFFDRLNGRPVILYVDRERIADYRFKRSLLDVIDSAHEYTYLTVYAWAELRWDAYRGQFEVQLRDLKHLAIYPGKAVVPAAVGKRA